MLEAPPHPRETERLQALGACHVLDTEPEDDFDGLVRLAARLLDVPVCLVSLVDAERQWFKARIGLQASETPRRLAFCAHAILEPDGRALIVHDAKVDTRFADNPLVVGPPSVQFYAGVPLRVGPDRLAVGTLCAIDHQPRTLSETQLDALFALARQVEVLLDGRRREVEQHRSLERLQRAEEQQRAVTTAMHDGVVMQDASGSIVWHNPAAERILGLTADQLYGRTSADPDWRATHEDGSPFPGDQHPAMVSLRTGQPVRDVVMGICPGGGAPRWISINSEPLFAHGAATPYAVVTSFHDITDTRQRAVQLAEARDHAEAAARAQREFLATMSHELRTPMNGVVGMVELMRAEGDLTERQAERLDTIHASSQALLRIINDILDDSKIEAGGRELDLEAVAAEPLARSVFDLLGQAATAQGLALELDVTADAVLWADHDALRQVLLNLVSNAVKFTAKGGVRVSARRDGDHVLVRVRDTGVGIPARERERIFERFAQVESFRTRRAGGTGLGLAISRRLIRAMGGELGVESEPGVGSTFWFSLPAAPEARVHRAAAPASAAPAVAPAPTRALRVLLVEDNPVNQRVAEGMLRHLGHHVEVAENGEVGLRAALRERFDVILMDVHMPVLDGLTATRRLRAAHAPSADAPVVALTASALADEREACLAAGMQAVVTKPITLRGLRDALEAAAPAETPPG
jgi:PAS domain S-box-containing protein